MFLILFFLLSTSVTYILNDATQPSVTYRDAVMLCDESRSLFSQALTSSSCRINTTMSTRGRSISPKPLQDADVDMENGANDDKKCKVVVINGLSRNVVQAHLQSIFAFYGDIVKIDLPLFLKCKALDNYSCVSYLCLYFSWPESRKSCPRVRRCRIRPKSRLTHEPRSIRWFGRESRII